MFAQFVLIVKIQYENLKFVCRGSVEEKIDALIASKKELAENVIGSGGEHWITELSNEELLSVLRLDEGGNCV